MPAKLSIFSRLQDYQRRSISHVAAAPEVSEEPGHWRAVAYRVGTRMLASSFEQVIEIKLTPAENTALQKSAAAVQELKSAMAKLKY